MIVAFRRHRLSPFDHCFYALQSTLAHPARSARHRGLQRYGISRLFDWAATSLRGSGSENDPQGRCPADWRSAWEFSQYVLEVVPYKIHTNLTDRASGTPLVQANLARARGIQFAKQTMNRNTIYSRNMRCDMICQTSGIEHRLTKPNHHGRQFKPRSLWQPRSAAKTSRGRHLCRGQQPTGLLAIPAAPTALGLRQNPQRPYPLRKYLQDMVTRTRAIHSKSDPSKAGAKP